MGRSFWGKGNIVGLAGLLAFAVSILVLFIPFKGESSMGLIDWHSPLGIIVIVLFAGAVGLYAWGIFKKDNYVSLKGARELLDDREESAAPIMPLIEQILARQLVLAGSAQNTPLTEYRDKYLKHTLNYRLQLQTRKREDTAWIYSQLFNRFFQKDNRYYSNLKKCDPELQNLNMRLQFALTSIPDKVLKKRIAGLWKTEHVIRSMQILENMSGINDIPNLPFGDRLIEHVVGRTAKALDYQLESVRSRLDEWRKGDDIWVVM